MQAPSIKGMSQALGKELIDKCLFGEDIHFELDLSELEFSTYFV